MVKRFQCQRYVGLILVAALGWTLVGCPKPQQRPGAWTSSSTTTPYSPREVVDLSIEPPDKAAIGSAELDLTMVPIDIELPAPAFRGTPVPLKEPNVEPPLGKPRPPFLAPEGTVNLARRKPVTASDPAPPAGEVDYVTDGDKEASDFGYLELRPGTEWVQIDLGQQATVYGVVVWHNHAEARVYRDVIVQAGDDPDFLDPQTVFNNDYDGSSGLEVGSDLGYVETNEGKLIGCKDEKGRYIKARYIRLYSKGSHIDSKNHYTEVEVYGKPAA